MPEQLTPSEDVSDYQQLAHTSAVLRLTWVDNTAAGSPFKDYQQAGGELVKDPRVRRPLSTHAGAMGNSLGSARSAARSAATSSRFDIQHAPVDAL